MEKFEGYDIGDNVKNLKECPNCGDTSYKPIAFVSTPMKEGKRRTFNTWTCFSCKKELVSLQD
jgi:ribosomal protein L37AE/L43A